VSWGFKGRGNEAVASDERGVKRKAADFHGATETTCSCRIQTDRLEKKAVASDEWLVARKSGGE